MATDLLIPVMFIGCLVFFQCLQVLVIAYKSEFVALAPFNRRRQRRTTHDCATPFYARQVFAFLELTHKSFSMLLAYLRLELVQDCKLRVLVFTR